MKLYKCLCFIIVFFIISTKSIYSQVGNTNGQYDEVVKQAFSILQDINAGNKKALKIKFTESNFQSKKEFYRTTKSSNLKWANEIITINGLPNKEDIAITGWKTFSKDDESSFSINITFYFKGKNDKYSNSDDHICINFIKRNTGIYLLNGLMLFKKSDFYTLKKLGNNYR